MITAIREGSRRIIAAVDDAARALGLRPGQTVAHAQALVPDLTTVPARPEADAAALARLAAWCLRYAPIVAPDPPDGIFIDIAGAAHLRGGEHKLLDDLVARLNRAGITVQASVADTPATAWAVARYGSDRVVPPGRMADAIASLPIQALRLSADTVASLREVGIERVAQLAAKSPGPLKLRFGPEILIRLDQALGHEPDLFEPLLPPDIPQCKRAFAEPIGDPEDLKRVVGDLTSALCRDLERTGLGVRRLDLVFRRVDRCSQAVCIGTAAPSRDPRHLARMLAERLSHVDPGFGIEEVALLAPRVQRLGARQLEAAPLGPAAADGANLGELVDSMTAQRGVKRVYRTIPVASELPERSVRTIPALAPSGDLRWPDDLPRPSSILTPPEPVRVVARLPDHPPALFIWRGQRRRVVHADGPLRVRGEWWRSDAELSSVRDYYGVEDEAGARFWLFRDAPAEAGGRWWLHGFGGT